MPLQVRMSEYNQLKGQMGAMLRKQGGNLAVRDLGDFVKKEDVVSTDNITTVFAVVSKYSKGEWLACYESLCEYVVRILPQYSEFAARSPALPEATSTGFGSHQDTVLSSCLPCIASMSFRVL